MARTASLALGLAVVLALVLFAVMPVHAQAPTKTFVVTTPDGVKISAQEWGNSQGPAILFIHGF